MAGPKYISALQKHRAEMLKKEPNRWRLPKKAIIITSFSVDDSMGFDPDNFGLPRLAIIKTVEKICDDHNTRYEGPILEMWITKNTSYVNAHFHMFGRDNKPETGVITWDLETGDLQAFVGITKDGEERTYK